MRALRTVSGSLPPARPVPSGATRSWSSMASIAAMASRADWGTYASASRAPPGSPARRRQAGGAESGRHEDCPAEPDERRSPPRQIHQMRAEPQRAPGGEDEPAPSDQSGMEAEREPRVDEENSVRTMSRVYGGAAWRHIPRQADVSSPDWGDTDCTAVPNRPDGFRRAQSRPGSDGHIESPHTSHAPHPRHPHQSWDDRKDERGFAAASPPSSLVNGRPLIGRCPPCTAQMDPNGCKMAACRRRR